MNRMLQKDAQKSQYFFTRPTMFRELSELVNLIYIYRFVFTFASSLEVGSLTLKYVLLKGKIKSQMTNCLLSWACIH